MKVLGHTFCALIMVMLLGAAIAQDAHGQVRGEDFRFIFDGGIDIPASTATVRDAYAIGVGASTGIGISVNQTTELLLRGGYTRHAFKDGESVTPLGNPSLSVEADEVLRGGALDIRAVSIELRRNLSRSARSVIPYIAGRMALTSIKASEMDYRPGISDDTWEFITGAGDVQDGRVGVLRFSEGTVTDEELRQSTVLRLAESSQTVWGAGAELGLKIPLSFTTAFTISGGINVGFADETVVSVPLRVGFHFGRH